jgi:hypothetical protein
VDWLHAHGNAGDAILYSILFMPEVSTVDDSILLAWAVSDREAELRFSDTLTAASISREVLEASFNFVEIGYLFDASGRDSTNDEDELLACLVRNAWDGWLKLLHPEREFKVEVLPVEVTGSTVGVHFFEIR